MITKQDRIKVLENIKDKEDKILVSKILDKANKCEASSSYICTNFLDLREFNIVVSVLNSLKVLYSVLKINENVEKKNILLMPSTSKNIDDSILKDYISCIKITTKSKGTLKHKDYMGSIYALGLKREYIGDIFAKDYCGYVLCMKSAEEYFLNNLFKVANEHVTCNIIDVFSDEVKVLDTNFKETKIIVPSMRADVILSEIYNLTRSEVKDKISRSDLYINSRNSLYGSELLKDDDIVSLKKYGKIKIEKVLRKTKNDKFELSIKKYS
jgi:RNA-binding protein YlmH